jgi:phosphatidylglycerol---prolipoprotein diacylglyceryl transferase
VFSDPIAFELGPLTFRWYALFILAGSIAGTWVAYRLARFRRLRADAILDIAMVSIIAGVLGARLYFVMLEWDYFSQNPLQILNIPRGGLSIHGGIVLGALSVIIMTWRMRQPVLSWLDVIAPGLAVGQAIGRWGNYANQEAFGGPTDLPWGIEIRPGNRPAEFVDQTHFHPTFFYESILNLINAAILTFVIVRFTGRSWLRTGDVLALYLINYGIIRLPLEWLRTDSLYIGPLPAAYWLSGALILTGVALIVLRRTVLEGYVDESTSGSQPAGQQPAA